MQWLFWSLSIIAALAAGFVVYRADQRRSVPMPWLTALLRTLIVLLVCLLLLAPSISTTKNEVRQPVVLFLQDDSRSIPEALQGDTATFRKKAEALLARLSEKFRVVKWSFGASTKADTLFKYKQEATDIAGALTKAQELYGQQNLGAIVLASDGRFNQGNHPLYQNLGTQASVHVIALGDSAPPQDLRIAQVYANRTVALNAQFEIRADILATGCQGYTNTATLQEVGGTTQGSIPLSISTDRFDKGISFPVLAQKTGLHHYIISLPAAEGERNTANNRRDVFIEVVDEKKKILIAAASPHPDVNAIREALAGIESYEVTVETNGLPSNLNAYDVLILHGLPSQGQILPSGLRIPAWYIISSQSNPAALNQAQKAVAIGANPAALQDEFAEPNTDFSLFTLPQGLPAVFDRMPPLAVPSGTFSLSGNAIPLFAVRNEPGTPLWVLQTGTPPVALLAGEGLWRWRLAEYRQFNQHRVVDECIRQTVSFLAANPAERPFRVELPKYVWSDQEGISFNAYLLNASNEPVNTSEAKLTITDSAGARREFSFERSGTAYRLNTGVWAAGTYRYVAKVSYQGKDYTAAGSFAVQSQPLELLQTGADYPLLNALARKYNGAFVPWQQTEALADSILQDKNLKPVIQSRTETVPLVDWKWYFLVLLVVAVAEWLLRKYWLAQ